MKLFDLAVYVKAKEIQWQRPDGFSNKTIRLGGFHITMNYLALMGKLQRLSGHDDLLVEAGVYGCNTTSVVLSGKSYNRGVRLHKLVMEALLRCKWQCFVKWLTEQEGVPNEEEISQTMKDSLSNISDGHANDDVQ